eukprot:525749_1
MAEKVEKRTSRKKNEDAVQVQSVQIISHTDNESDAKRGGKPKVLNEYQRESMRESLGDVKPYWFATILTRHPLRVIGTIMFLVGVLLAIIGGGGFFVFAPNTDRDYTLLGKKK